MPVSDMTKGQRAWRAAKWAAINGALGWLCYAWLFLGIEWAKNVFCFFFWVTVVIATLVVYSTEATNIMRDRGRSVPDWLSASIDVVLIIILAAFGHFWMAGFWIFQLVCEFYVYDADATPKPETQNAK